MLAAAERGHLAVVEVLLAAQRACRRAPSGPAFASDQFGSGSNADGAKAAPADSMPSGGDDSEYSQNACAVNGPEDWSYASLSEVSEVESEDQEDDDFMQHLLPFSDDTPEPADRPALHIAAAHGRDEVVRALLDAQPRLQHLHPRLLITYGENEDGIFEAIRIAARRGHLSTVLALSEAVPQDAASAAATAKIILAIMRLQTVDGDAYSEVVRALLALHKRVSADVPAPSSPPTPPTWHNSRALQWAVDTDCFDAVCALMSSDFPAILSQGAMGGEAIERAVECGDEAILTMLLSARAREDTSCAAPDSMRALETAFTSESGEATLLRWLLCSQLEKAANAEEKLRVIVDKLLSQVNLSSGVAVRTLLGGQAGSYPAFHITEADCSTWELIDSALETASHRSPTVEALLERVPPGVASARPGFGGRALRSAATIGCSDSVRLLCWCSAVDVASVAVDADEQGNTALHIAAREDEVAVLQEILRSCSGPDARRSAGPILNAADACESTALHVAASWRHGECVAALLDAGADCSLRNASGHTALEAAACGWHHAWTTELSSVPTGRVTRRRSRTLGAADPGDQERLTAVESFFAVEGGFAQVVRLLLRAEARNDRRPDRDYQEPSTEELMIKLSDLTKRPLPPGAASNSGARTCPREPPSTAAAVQCALLHADTTPAYSSVAAIVRDLLWHATSTHDATEVVRLVLHRYPRCATLAALCRELLPVAAEHGNAYVLTLLLEAALDPDSAATERVVALWQALRAACAAGHASAVRVLLGAQWPDQSLTVALSSGDGVEDDLALLKTAAKRACDAKLRSLRNSEAVEALLAAGADPREMPGGKAAILDVVRASCIDYNTVRALLRHPGQLGLQDKEGRTALHLTLGCMDVDVLHMLLCAHAAQGVSVDTLDKNGFSPLFTAVRRRDATAAHMLMQAGADTRFVQAEHGHSLLHATASYPDGVIELHFNASAYTARLLFTAPLPPDAKLRDCQGYTAAQLAAREGDVRYLRAMHEHARGLLVELPGEAEPLQPSLLWLAALHDRPNVIRCLLSLPAQVDASLLWYERGMTDSREDAACCMSGSESDPEAANVRRSDGDGTSEVQAEGADEGCTTVTALMLAAARGSHDCVLALLSGAQRGCLHAKCSAQKRTALHYAARYGHTGILRSLVAAHRAEDVDFDVDVKDAFGGTPLQYAVESGWWASVKYLLSEGADCRHKAAHGRSLLKIALACKGTSETVYICTKLLEQDCSTGHFELVREVLLPSTC